MDFIVAWLSDVPRTIRITHHENSPVALPVNGVWIEGNH